MPYSCRTRTAQVCRNVSIVTTTSGRSMSPCSLAIQLVAIWWHLVLSFELWIVVVSNFNTVYKISHTLTNTHKCRRVLVYFMVWALYDPETEVVTILAFQLRWIKHLQQTYLSYASLIETSNAIFVVFIIAYHEAIEGEVILWTALALHTL